MDIPTVPGSLYTVATKTTCDITDTVTGTPIDSVSSGSVTFTAQGAVTTLSDPAATYSKVNFKNAAAALRMLGGGDQLPNGYLAAAFLESTGTQYIDTGLKGIKQNSFIRFDGVLTASVSEHGSRAFHAPGWTIMAASGGGRIYVNTPNTDFTSFFSGYYNLPFEIPFKIKATIIPGELVFNGKKLTYAQLNDGNQSSALSFSQTLKLCAYSVVSQYATSRWRGRIERFRARLDKEIDFFPALFNGVPCMFDKVSKQPFYNDGTGAFIVGMTLAQARQLGKLPAGGGTLKILLPENYTDDEAVAAAISTANANGWILPTDTYTSAEASARPFSIRRIWVKKNADPDGAYVDASGSRWHVEKCQTVFGAEPTDLGYEPFRSVDVALAEWELTPYVYPEEETLSI